MPIPVFSRDRPRHRRADVILSLCLAVACLVPTPYVIAQSESGVYAITGARLVTLTGEVIDKGIIILRDGLIEAIGQDITPPVDAIVIDAEGLTVYPGFIDAFSQAGLTRPEQGEHLGNIASRLSSDSFGPESNDLNTYRKQGFTTALIARNDGIFAGQAVLINLKGDDVPRMTVKAPVIQVMGYESQRDYPGTLMAVVAYQRQTLIDAAYHDLLKTRYSRDPKGMARPPADQNLDALIPVAKGQEPVLGIVHIENDFKRLKNLSEEYGIQYWIAGAEEAFRIPDLIRSAGVPVIVSLNYPSIQQVTGYWFDRAYRKLDDEEKKRLDERDEAAVHQNAAAVLKTGVPMALGTGGMRNVGDFLKNLRLAVRAGLPAEEALKALTINPARLFGVDEVMGTLEPGKIANLTVTAGDIFTEDGAHIAHLFIDGRKETFPIPRPGGETSGGDASGQWDLELSVEGMTIEMTMNLTQDGEDVEGTLDIMGEEMSLSGTFSEGRLRLTGTIPDESSGRLTLNATIDGDTISGTVIHPEGTTNFTGKRIPGDLHNSKGGPKDDR